MKPNNLNEHKMKTYNVVIISLCFLVMLLSSASSDGLLNYEIVNNTCYESSGNVSIRVDMSYCVATMEDKMPDIILYEKSSSSRCYTDSDCPAGTICSHTGECIEPVEPNDLTLPGIIFIVLVLFLLLKFK